MEKDAWKNLEVTLKFTGGELQNLVDALANLPYHLSANFISAIHQQTTVQFAEFEIKAAKQKQTAEAK